jgi:hypothetical protein
MFMLEQNPSRMFPIILFMRIVHFIEAKLSV